MCLVTTSFAALRTVSFSGMGRCRTPFSGWLNVLGSRPARSRLPPTARARVMSSSPGWMRTARQRDITVRDTLAPSRPVRSPSDVPRWFETQEREKVTKYRECRRLGWSLVPFVMDCFGGMGGEARGLVGTLLKLLLGQKELWARRTAEADAWQAISLALAQEVGRQLRLSCYINQPSMMEGEGDGGGGVHNPYAMPS